MKRQKKRKLGSPSDPKNAELSAAAALLIQAWFCLWSEPLPSEWQEKLLQRVRQARCDLHEVADAAGVSGRRMERIAKAAFKSIRLTAESLN
jgi:hypothetical protein